MNKIKTILNDYRPELIISLILLLAVGLIILFAYVQTYGQSRYVVPVKKELLEASYDTLLNQIGVRERTGHNDGYKVEQYLNSVGLKKGNPYCAAGQYWCWKVACIALHLPEYAIPILKTGLANGLYIDAIKKGKVAKTNIPYKHDLVIWKQYNSYFGHVERIINVLSGICVETVGCNTVGNNTGSGNQREGQGVYKKVRYLNHPLSHMFVRGYIGFKPI